MAFSLQRLFDILKEIVTRKFTGSLEIHFTEGGIGKVIKHEQVK